MEREATNITRSKKMESDISTLVSTVAELKRGLLGSEEFGEEGVVGKVNRHEGMFQDYLVTKKVLYIVSALVSFMGVQSILDFIEWVKAAWR